MPFDDMLEAILAEAEKAASMDAVLDGWIDKVMYVNVAWTLVNLHDVPAWWMLAWFSREILQGIFVPILVPAYYRGLPRARTSTVLGKATTWLVGLSLVASLLDLWTIALVLTPCAGVTGFVSASRYLVRELSDLRRSHILASAPTATAAPSEPTLERAPAAR